VLAAVVAAEADLMRSSPHVACGSSGRGISDEGQLAAVIDQAIETNPEVAR
jgi:hypothetical protein